MSAVQEVNLYQPKNKVVRGALSAGSAQVLLIAVGVTLLGLWGFADWQTRRLDAAVQVVRTQAQAQAALSASHGPQLDGMSDEDLEALLARLNKEVDVKSRALAMLTSESRQPGTGFSARLRAFGTRHVDGIWLDRLTLGTSVEAVSISGSTESPDSVPAYLRSLAQDPALKGGQIDEFFIEKPKDKKAPGAGRLSFRAGHRGLVQRENTDEEKS